MTDVWPGITDLAAFLRLHPFAELRVLLNDVPVPVRDAVFNKTTNTVELELDTDSDEYKTAAELP